MAITDEVGRPPAEFERQPPQDVAAEQSVLGGMLLSKDAIADVVEVLRSTDFYRPAHQVIYDTILNLYGRGEPADPVAVSAELTRSGQLMRVGGSPYLHTLISSVPTAANAGYYAQIVAERAVLRRLVEAGTRIVHLGYGAAAGQGGNVDEVVDRAQAAIYDVTEHRMSEDYVRLEELLQGTMDEIDAISSRGGASVGVPTGFSELDQITNGLHAGQMVIVAARPAIGKALALDTPLPTPSGWTTMGEVRVGDWLIGADGRPTQVVAATEVMHGRPCYEVEFSDGTVIVADEAHQWRTTTGPARRVGVVTTADLAATLRRDPLGGRGNHAVPVAGAYQLPECDLPVPPYRLGVWLAGAGPTRVTSPDPVPPPAGSDPAAPVQGIEPAVLRSMGVLGNRHIPPRYLRASARQRRALLAGLLDVSGQVAEAGAVWFAATNRQLARDVHELVLTLGHPAVLRTRPGRAGGPPTYLVDLVPREAVSRLDRTAVARAGTTRASASRDIVAVRPVESVPVRCVQVDNTDHLYLASRSMIPTHNSTLGLDFARSCSIRNGLTSVIFSLEMSRSEITMRLLSAEAKVPLHHMRSGHMSDDDWARLARRMGEVADAPLYIDDSPNLTMMEIRAKARRLRQRHDLRLIVVDYLQLLTSGRRVESRQQEVSEFSRSLKLLAKELEIPVIAICQLNRGPEQRNDKKPMLADLRESGCMTRETTLLRADTGAPVTFGDLLDNGHDGVLLWSLDENRRLVPAPVTNVFPSGTKETYRLRLATGREVTASGNHRFLTIGGWVTLDALSVSDRIAIPRRTPAPIGAGLGWSEHRLGLLAHLIGAGRVLPEQVNYRSRHEDNLRFVIDAAAAEFGLVSQPVRQKGGLGLTVPTPADARGDGHPIHAWFAELGIDRVDGRATRLPDLLYSADDAEVALFLRHLWATGGTGPNGDLPDPCYSSPSRVLVDGVATLLSRFGIVARIHPLATDVPRSGWRLVIADALDISRFRTLVDGQAGGRDSATDTAATDMREPVDDIRWDRVVAIEPLGPQPVYDATVKETHNFVANGIVAHNSLEQDADMVILLYREDAFEKESPRAGEADLILAKHRNGPTATVTVAFQGHYSRFIDMQQG
ncbi:MAG TPA: replicative DNA helicase [Mycobacteriales bacterium]